MNFPNNVLSLEGRPARPSFFIWALVHLMTMHYLSRGILSAAIILLCFSHVAMASSPKRIALTFDADMTYAMQKKVKQGTMWYSPELVKYLEQEKIPATIFMTGLWAQTYPDEAKYIAKDSLFEIGNHSYSHPGFESPCYKLPRVHDKAFELDEAQKAIREVTGVTPTLFRFPGGCHNAADDALVEKHGLRVAEWDVVSGDAFSKKEKSIVHNVVHQAHDGAVVVMHLGGPHASATPDAVRDIVVQLRKEGYIFVQASELIQ